MMDVVTIASIGAALSDPTRVRVLELANGKLAVGEIAVAVGITSATTSHHLAVLQRGGLVELTWRGRRTVPRRIDDGLRVLVGGLG